MVRFHDYVLLLAESSQLSQSWCEYTLLLRVPIVRLVLFQLLQLNANRVPLHVHFMTRDVMPSQDR